jgi:hypothetical protein
MSHDIVREHELHSLVVDLDRGVETLECCSSLEITDDNGGTLVALALHDCLALERMLQRVADYLAGLQYRRRE